MTENYIFNTLKQIIVKYVHDIVTPMYKENRESPAEWQKLTV